MPTPASQTPQATTSVPPQIQRHDLAALALEVAAAVAASKALKAQMRAIVKASLLSWTRLFGPSLKTVQSGPRYVAFMRQLSTDLKAVQVDPGPVLVEFAAKARELGVTQAFAEAKVDPVPLWPETDHDAREQAKRAAESAAKAAREKVRASARLAREQAKMTSSGPFTVVTEVLAPAQQAVNDVEAAAKTVTNDALNQGIADVADKTDGQLLWVAERDACLVCAALSGHVVDSNGYFDQSLTFGTKAYPHKAEDVHGNWVAAPLIHPPRHRRCRCRCTVFHGLDVTDPTGLPMALRREAERSVLRGWSLPSESEGVRRSAADRLLAKIGDSKGSLSPSGWAVPQSVKDRARRSLAKGTFTTGPVPTGRR